jgi:crotonobetainyl-CoA:carnitine CoA-transferase CaiB-like acyl-CoA transferase
MPLVRERGMLQPAAVPGRAQPVTLVNAGVVTDKDGPGLQGPVPALGADTQDVLLELGYSEAEIARLRERGTI